MLFQSLRLRLRIAKLLASYMNVQKMIEDMYSFKSLSSAEAPAGYPYYIYKNSNNRKNRKRAGDDRKREKAGASLLSSPSHRASRALFFFLPSLVTTQRGLRGGERL